MTRWAGWLLVVAVAGCAAPTESAEALSLIVTLDRAAIAPGDVVNITAVLHVGQLTTIENRGCPAEDVLFSIRGQSPGTNAGRIEPYRYGVEPLVSGCAISLRSLPTGEHTFVAQWNARITPAAPDEHAPPDALPGTYEVAAQLNAIDRDITARATVLVTG